MTTNSFPNSRAERATQATTPIHEDRPNAAICFRPHKTAPAGITPADFTGVIVVPKPGKFWVNLYRRIASNGQEYFALRLKRKTTRRE
jgi:hypothetical protein